MGIPNFKFLPPGDTSWRLEPYQEPQSETGGMSVQNIHSTMEAKIMKAKAYFGAH